MPHPARRLHASLAAFVLLVQISQLMLPAAVFAQGGGTSNVQRGQEYYEQSRFDEAIGLLKDLVDRGALMGDDLLHARELLARSYVKKGYPVQGKEMFKAILKANPQWRPDPIRVPPDETAVFEQALKEYTTEAAGETPPTPGGTPPPTETKPAPTPAPVTPPPAPPVVKQEPAKTAQINPNAGQGEGKKSSKMLWYILGGAVVVGGLAAAAGGGGGGGGGTPPPAALPGYPPPPSP